MCLFVGIRGAQNTNLKVKGGEKQDSIGRQFCEMTLDITPEPPSSS